MELKNNPAVPAGQGANPDTFRRVWDRVMPDQTNSPVAVDVPETAVPARPTPPMERGCAAGRSPVPTCPAEPGEERPPVPTCPAEPGEELPPVPTCPAEPGEERRPVPTCPAEPYQKLPPVPTCPAEPGTPRPPLDSVWPELCLGESARGDTQVLEKLMTLARTGAAAAQWVSMRLNGNARRSMSAIAADHRRALRQLSAAYFLITGKRYQPPKPKPQLPLPILMALRARFVWEQSWEQTNKNAAGNTADPCLKALYQELAQDGALHAGTIRSLLEQMCST